MDELEQADAELDAAIAEANALHDALDNVVHAWNVGGERTDDRAQQMRTLHKRIRANQQRIRTAELVVDQLLDKRLAEAQEAEAKEPLQLLALRDKVEELEDEVADLRHATSAHLFEAVTERLETPRQKPRR